MLLPKKILTYYNRELSFLRHYGAAFAKRFPKIAKRLGIAEGISEDPHVERLVEAFAFLTAKIHQHIDEDMPELANAILETLAPQFIRQVPSVSLVQFQQDALTSGVTGMSSVARHTTLFSRPAEGVVCRFRTVYPLTMLPLSLSDVSLMPDPQDSEFVLSMNFNLWPGASFRADTIRIYLDTVPILAYSLYELMSSQVAILECHTDTQSYTLNVNQITTVGFDAEDSLCHIDMSINPIHHLFRDYFSFQERFLFIDIPLPNRGMLIEKISKIRYRFRFKDCIALRRIERMSDKICSEIFRLNCVPVVNLFSHQAEPLTPKASEYEYLVQPDARQPLALEVYTIQNVTMMRRKHQGPSNPRSIPPLFGLNHGWNGEVSRLFWQATQRPSSKQNDSGINTFIGFTDASGLQLIPETDVVMLELTCTNRDIPQLLTNGHPDGDFESETALPGVKILGLIRPRLPIRPQLSSALNWRLISQLSLNQQLISGKEGAQLIKETLELYNLQDDPAASRLISQLKDIQIKPLHKRLDPAYPSSLAHGLEVWLTFHPQASEFIDFYMFCSLLERFIGMYAPINSFTQTVTQIESVNNSVTRWPCRSGRLLWI